tara:strand:+ start:655 stop:951 length:297 start_codon:yes stop_codon:yes gene_type:complete
MCRTNKVEFFTVMISFLVLITPPGNEFSRKSRIFCCWILGELSSNTSRCVKNVIQLIIVSGFALGAMPPLTGCSKEDPAEDPTEEQEQAMEEEGQLEE